MRFRTFLVTGIEVLALGGQRWESNAWPAEHWREHKGRFRLFTTAIDEKTASALADRHYGGLIEGIVVVLEVADFSAWPAGTFTIPNAPPSFKTRHRDLFCYAKLDWQHIQHLTLKQQFEAYIEAVISALELMSEVKRKSKGFRLEECSADLRAILGSLKASSLTRSAYMAAQT